MLVDILLPPVPLLLYVLLYVLLLCSCLLRLDEALGSVEERAWEL